MIVHSFLQGSPEWHAHRATHFNASDAPAMMGCSPYETRSQLLHRLHTGIAPEVDAGTQRRFDDGHRFEALARPLAVKIIGEELYPVTGVDGRYSASFDGLTIFDDTGWEHKRLNEILRMCLPKDVIYNIGGDKFPLMYKIQMEHQFLVSGASKTLFSATDWDAEGGLLDQRHAWYNPDLKLRAEIVAGWVQFAQDLAAYTPPEVAAPVVAKTVSALPVVFDMRVEGKLVSCNLSAYKPAALAYIEAINSNLVTDQDFADADKDAKYCRESAKKLGLSIEQALGQMGDINEAISMVREIAATFDAKGLLLEKLVKSEKEARKLAIVTAGREAFAAHHAALNTRLGKPYMPSILADFAGVTKGLKTVASMENAVNTELARAKIEANAVADKIQANLATLVEFGSEYKFLFGDTANIVLKDNDDLTALVKTRIAEHQAKEAAKEEATRQRIRAEEQAKAEREARAKLAAEQAAELAEARRLSVMQAQGEKVAKEFATQAQPVAEIKPVAITAPAVAAFVAKPANKTVTRADINAALDATHADYFPQILAYLRGLTVVVAGGQ